MFDLKSISDIKGYSTLKEDSAKMFQLFLNNFLNAWGIEARETIKPISVKLCRDSGGVYLRFDYKIYGKREWLHVISSKHWW